MKAYGSQQKDWRQKDELGPTNRQVNSRKRARRQKKKRARRFLPNG